MWGGNVSVEDIKEGFKELQKNQRVDSSFRKEAKGYVHFLGARKRNQKNIHPTKPPLYGRM
jgi:hypothetical protein